MLTKDEVDEFLNQSLKIVEEYEQGNDVSQQIKALTLPEQLDEDIIEVYRVVHATCKQRLKEDSVNLHVTPRRGPAIRIPRLNINKLNSSEKNSTFNKSSTHESCSHTRTHKHIGVTSGDFVYLAIFIVFIGILIFLLYPPHRSCQPI